MIMDMILDLRWRAFAIDHVRTVLTRWDEERDVGVNNKHTLPLRVQVQLDGRVAQKLKII